ncbi:Tetratricopeptide repeat-containing protein [Modicisalibacter muralis]|uniref:Tetratricopeptide repeat-containing protein n=1 Tax=Modicisalibacter muralis TaxID=119000 RepID=A0A1G9LHH1_9GAMM|nr:tetratricopeptide repeat protein [Halomonas muralis]SDL60965.1 Tetratricopeptide repeat-containing protein [Halomonas muralis]
MRARLVTTALAAALLAGCQGLPSGSTPEILDDPMASAPPITQGLDAQGLSTLLIAELAGQRGDFERAANGYLRAAERYESPALAERATLAARYADDPALLLRAAERWRQLAPDAEAPARLLAGLALQRGDWQASLEQRLALAARNGQGDLVAFAETAIEQGAPLPPLIARLRQYLDDDTGPGEPAEAILALALLEAANDESRRAEARLAALAETHPELPALWLARARIALQDERLNDARNAAQRGLTLAPNDSRFILLLAQAQLRSGDIESAEAHLDTLIERHPEAPSLRLALARLYLEEGYNAPARRLLLPLIDSEPAPTLAYLLLGTIAADQGNVDNALLYYRQVPPGDGFIESRLRAARALVEADRLLDARDFLHIERLRHPEMASELIAMEIGLLDEQDLESAAMALLNRQIRQNPDDTQLRFMRAMRLYDMGNLAGMERDLRHIIEREPDNAMALNALGYTLADRTERYQEALELIQRAHRLEPESPAILDSLGWVYHKLGDDRRALPYLRKAYASQQDQEIAAHLAEVLWRLERRDEARALIAEAIARFDERPLIDDLLERIPALAPRTDETISP